MADIRSLLRNELASRKGGAQAGNAGARVTKKRKVDDVDEITRKRIRSTHPKSDQQAPDVHDVQPPSEEAIEDEERVEQTEEAAAGPELSPQQGTEEQPADANLEPAEATDASKQQAEPAPPIDEDEWAAFERDVAAPTRMPQAPAAVAAQATISAAPMTAEELAEQQQREKDAAGRARESEAEGEREDAARFMEDEFDEMEQLEERVRRLKHKREELRQKGAANELKPQQDELASERKGQDPEAGVHSEEDDDDDDEDDDWDNWRFR